VHLYRVVQNDVLPPTARTKLFQTNLNMPSCRGWKTNEGILFLWHFILIPLRYRNDHPSAYFFYSKSDKMNRPYLSGVKIKFHKNKCRLLVFHALQDGVAYSECFEKVWFWLRRWGEHIILYHPVYVVANRKQNIGSFMWHGPLADSCGKANFYF